jgi:pimeloyl-ACP methyl ester carboxylesterase
MQWCDETVQGRGARLFVRRVVDPPSPPVLLLHGLGVGGSIWQSFARRLLPHLAAVAPDLRGHGQSDAPASGYAPADYANDLPELIETERQPSMHGQWPVPVVGHSLGALVAMAMAELRPDLVSWVVLLDPPLDPDIPNSEVPNVYRLRHAPAGELEAYLLSRNPGGGPLLAHSLAKLFRQASDAAFEAMLDPDDRAGRAPALTTQAAHITNPVLVVQADPARGGVLGDAAARQFVDSLPNGTLIKINGATHAVHASHPAEVARAILDFGGYSSDVPSDSV